MPSKASGLDFLNNKANLQQAKFQRLLDHVSSASARADENSRKQEELDREQDEIFKNSSELSVRSALSLKSDAKMDLELV